MGYILTSRQDSAAVLTINRPEALNAINSDLLDELERELKDASATPGVRTIIITGQGKAFVAGGDIAAMSKFTAEDAKAFSCRGHQVFDLISKLPQLVIAAINGYALGGGCELAMACDIRIASSKARLGLPETTLGLIPGFGGSQRLPRLVGTSKALMLMSAGNQLQASQALEMGLVDEVTEPENLMERCIELSNGFARNSASAIAIVKKAVYEGAGLTLHEGQKIEEERFGDVFETSDHTEGISAFLEKRSPSFKDA